MKSIMLSTNPKWVAKIMNGEKTIEIRKRFPKDFVGWVYIYCTKDKKYANLINRGGFLTGMVVAKFTLDKVEEIKYHNGQVRFYSKGNEHQCIWLKETCLTFDELDNYLKGKNGYDWHISNLVIFDKPKELSEFYKIRCKYVDENNDCLYCNNNRQCPFAEIDYNPDDSVNAYICGKPKKPLTHAPQSWQYVEVE